MTQLALFLEEPSAKAMLQSFLPSILPEGVEVSYVVFQGKQDLQIQINRKLKKWLRPDTRFIILQDQDSSDCKELKQKLFQLCQESGKEIFYVRIACHALESWYLGDLLAVEQALNLTGLAAKQHHRKYRNPDHLNNPNEELAKLTEKCYQKIDGSRQIGKCLSIDRNNSPGFRVFVNAIQRSIE
ncbi:MAG: DUF4276 family protein [Anaerolineaceae bacterium]|nr:DUF4276 family protein [Anaerolineaceae bacterium]